MKFTLYELEHSGDKAKIFSPMIDGENETLYEQFIAENIKRNRKELANIDERLYTIGHKCGLFEESFYTKSGKFGENLCTLKDIPKRKLRLFFTEFGLCTIILGGGGYKAATIRATQDDPVLNAKNRQIGEISITLQKAQKAGDFTVNPNGTIESTTNFTYNSDDYE